MTKLEEITHRWTMVDISRGDFPFAIACDDVQFLLAEIGTLRSIITCECGGDGLHRDHRCVKCEHLRKLIQR